MGNKILDELGIDYLLVNCTNEFLTEYSALSENSRYVLTGFSGSTGDALLTKDGIYLFVDGRYHIQADCEARNGVKVVKLKVGQNQDDEIRKIIHKDLVLGIIAKKVSQARLEKFSGYNVKLLDKDPINEFTEIHSDNYSKVFREKNIKFEKPTYITKLEEVSYLMGLRDFSLDGSAKIWATLFVDKNNKYLFSDKKKCHEFLKKYDGEVFVDKTSINAFEYNLLKKPVDKISDIKKIMSIKSDEEIISYKNAFEKTDKTMMSIRKYIEENNDLSEYDIAMKLREEFIKNGAKSLSFNSIVAIDKNSALAHYSKNSKEVCLKEGSLVLIDCGAYYEGGLATDITRVFVKGRPSEIQKKVYTTVLKSFLNVFNASLKTGFEYDTLAHTFLDNTIEGFVFNHGLGHGIGISVHEAPPNLSQNEIAKCVIENGMTFTIEPGLYNSEFFGVRLENSCYKKDGKIYSFVNMGYEKKLIDFDMLNKQEKLWLKDFNLL